MHPLTLDTPNSAHVWDRWPSNYGLNQKQNIYLYDNAGTIPVPFTVSVPDTKCCAVLSTYVPLLKK